MTTDETWFLVGSLVLSFSITYAWWVKVRVVRVRQDLFDIRDELFDFTCAIEMHGDPAYRICRQRLNAVIRMAATISLPTLVYLYVCRRSDETPEPRSESQDLQNAIDSAYGTCARRILDYVMRETLSGIIVQFILVLGSPWLGKKAKPEFQRGVKMCIDSGVAESLPKEYTAAF